LVERDLVTLLSSFTHLASCLPSWELNALTRCRLGAGHCSETSQHPELWKNQFIFFINYFIYSFRAARKIKVLHIHWSSISVE
jgi:hypothetical protein